MGKSVLLGCVVLVLVGVLVVGGLAVGAYNRLNTVDQAVNGAWADVENNYQRRADLVPNLVETVKGAANFEKSTLEAVIQARASATPVKLVPNAVKDPEAFATCQQAQDGLSSALSRLLVTVERYPELKANQNFRDLQVQLEGTENRIAVSRNRFNEATQAYNTMRKSFPTVIVANFAGFKDRPYFKSTAGAEKAPSVKF
jgi:LemA protein